MAVDRMNQHPFRECAHCGASFEPGVSYPVETCEGPDGQLELYSFCDEACRAAWAGDD